MNKFKHILTIEQVRDKDHYNELFGLYLNLIAWEKLDLGGALDDDPMPEEAYQTLDHLHLILKEGPQ